MNGIITISDGIATMENGNLTNVDSLDANTTNSTTMTTTTQPPGTNNTTVATTAFVNNNLLAYALLNPVTPQTFTGSHNFPTQLTTNSSTLVATTAYVKSNLLNYALLAYNNIYNANNTFNGITNFNSILNINSTSARFSSGVNTTSINQNGIAFSITNLTNNNSIRLNTKNSSGVGQDNVFALDGNTAGLQGDNGNTITIVGTQATIGGTSVPKITTQPLTASNNNEIASTAFVKNQGYALLDSNNTFTGINTFTIQSVRFNAGFVQNDIGGGSNSTSMYQTGASCSITNNYNNGSIRLYTKNNSGVGQDGVYALGGVRAGLQGDSGNTIEIFGTQATIGGTSVPKITTQPLTSSNTNEIASTAFVKTNLLSYALLAGTQTFTGINTFSGISNINNTAFYNATDARFVSSTSESTQMYQVGGGFTISSISNGKFIALNTKDATGATNVNGLVCRDGNQSYLQSNTNTVNRIDITGNQVTIGGVNVPVITTQPLNTSNNNEIASTAFVKNQSYAVTTSSNAFTANNTFITQATPDNSTLAATTAFVKNQNYITNSALSPYGLLNPPAIQTWGTNQNTFTTQINANDGVRFTDTFSSKISQSGNALVIENISNVNSVQIRSTTAGLVQRTGLLIENGITCTLQGGTGNTITITGLNTPTLGIPPVAGVYSNEIATTSWVNSELSGISDAPYTCNYNTLSPVPTKTTYDIGYIWQIPGSAFPNWTTFTTTQNIATMVFNGTGNYTKGVWQVNIVLSTECINAPNSRLIWTTVSPTSNDLTKYCTYENSSTLFGILGVQIMKLSFILNVSSTPSTYYLNYVRTSGVGSGLNENKTNSHIEFTRIA
jgi:hypothetical protein